MSFLAFGLNGRRKTAELRHAALKDLVPPPMEHPELGVAGRSIELSLSLGKPISPDAIVLASETLHEFVQRLVKSRNGGTEAEVAAARSAVAFLSKASIGVQLPGEARDLLSRVARDLTAMP